MTTSNLIRYGCLSFPEGSVHFVDVGADPVPPANDKERPKIQQPLLAKYRGHYVICSERKLLEQAFEEECESLVLLPLPEGLASYVFLAHDLYCDVAARIFNGELPEQIGEACPPLRRRMVFQAQLDGNCLEAMVVGIDSYGNANLNVTYDEFKTICAGRSFRVDVEWRAGSNDRFDTLCTVSGFYGTIRMGSLLLTVSSTGQLQLAINRGSAAQLVGLSYASRCRFTFV